MTVYNFSSRSYGSQGWQRMLVGNPPTGGNDARPAIIYVPGGGWGLRDPLPFTDLTTSTFVDPVSWAIQNPQNNLPKHNDDQFRLFVLNVASDANQGRSAVSVTAGGNNPTGAAANTTLAAGILAADVTAPIAARTTQFPKGGYVQIGTEIIRYTGIDETVQPPELTGLVRGAKGTSASDHLVDQPVIALHWVDGEHYPAGTILRGLYRARRSHVSSAGVNQPGDVIESTLASAVTVGDTTYTVAVGDGVLFDGVDQATLGGGEDGLSAGTITATMNFSSTSAKVTSTAAFPESGMLRMVAIAGSSEGVEEYAYYANKTATQFNFVGGSARGQKGGVRTSGGGGQVEVYLASETVQITGVTGDDLTVASPEVHGVNWPAGIGLSVPSDYYWENIGGELDEAGGIARIPGRGENSPAYAAQAALDVQTAISYIRKNAAELGVDPDKITVYGSSAGGHAVAIAAYGPDMVRTSSLDPRSVNAGRIANGRPDAVMLDITPAFLNEYVTTNDGNNGIFLSFMRDAYGIKGQSLGFGQWGSYPENFKKSLDGAALISETRKIIPTVLVYTGYKYNDRSPAQVQNGAAAPAEWDALTTYNQYDTVKYDNKFWIAQATSQGSTPGTNYADWAQAQNNGNALAPEVHHAYNGWRFMRELTALGATDVRLITADDSDPAVRDIRLYTQVPADPSDGGASGTDYTVTAISTNPKKAAQEIGHVILAELETFLGIV